MRSKLLKAWIAADTAAAVFFIVKIIKLNKELKKKDEIINNAIKTLNGDVNADKKDLKK